MGDLDGLLSLYPNLTVKFYQQKFSISPKSLTSLKLLIISYFLRQSGHK